MEVAINYYDLLIGLDSEHCSPFEFVCCFGENSSSARLAFDKGLFSKVEILGLENKKPLDSSDMEKVVKILEQNLQHAVKCWTDFHLYKLPIETVLLTSRVKG